MTALRKIVDSSALTEIFDLPPAFINRKVEIVMLPIEEEKIPCLTMAQIEEWAKTPEIQSLVGALKSSGLPSDISISDIRKKRLAEKYKTLAVDYLVTRNISDFTAAACPVVTPDELINILINKDNK